jgi:hypothetical protein
MILEMMADLVERISKEQKEHNTGLTRFVVYGPIVEQCSVMDWVSLPVQPDGSKIGQIGPIEPIGEIGKIFQLSIVPSTHFKFPEPFLCLWLEQTESNGNSIWNDRFNSLLTVPVFLSENTETANQHCERNSFMIAEAILSFEDKFCELFVVFSASELMILPELNRIVNVGVMTHQSSILDYSKSMVDVLFNLKFESNSFLQNEVIFKVF